VSTYTPAHKLARDADKAQTGIGTEADLPQAMRFYRAAADGGDKRAQKRLQSNDRRTMSALDRRAEMDAMKEDYNSKGGKGDNCLVM